MSFPLSVHSTFVDLSTPYVSADFLNQVQTYMVGAYLGTRSLKAVVVDGTGAVVAAPTAGTITASSTITSTIAAASDAFFSTNGNITLTNGKVTAFNGGLTSKFYIAEASNYLLADTLASGTAAPTSSVPLGALYRDGMAIGWAHVVVAGAAISSFRGVNIKSITYSATGIYVVTFRSSASGSAPANPTTAAVFVTPDTTNDLRVSTANAADGSGDLQVTVNIRDTGPAALDSNFNILAFCG